jgi:hypothetical protein
MTHLVDIPSTNNLVDVPPTTRLVDIPPTTQTNTAGRRPPAGTPSLNWAYWALPVVALTGLSWYLSSGDRTDHAAVQAPQKLAQTEIPAPPSPKPGEVKPGEVKYLSAIPSDSQSIATYLNRDVYSRAGERRGRISDLLVAPDGRIRAAVLRIGSFLGIGEKEVALPFAAWETARTEDGWHFVVDAGKQTLQDAPAFERTGEALRSIAPGVTGR